MAAKVGRTGLLLVLIATAVTMGLAVAHKGLCARASWEGNPQFGLFCYSDLFPLYGSEQLQDDRVPFLDACEKQPGVRCDEYPPGTMYAMYGAALFADDSNEFFWWNMPLLVAAAFVTTAVIFSLVGRRALYFAAAPSLVLYGTINWDLIPVAFATVAVWAYLREKHGTSGILLGIGTAAKLYPGLLAIPLAAGRLRERRFSDTIEVVGGTIVSWLAINLPFYIGGREGWLTFFRYNQRRGADPDSLYAIFCNATAGEPHCIPTPTINLISAVAFVVLSTVLYLVLIRRAPDFPRWMFAFPLLIVFLLTNKVYSPQYSLWLLPWFALTFRSFKLFALFQVADVLVFFTRFSWLGTLLGMAGFTLEAFNGAVVIRDVTLVLCLIHFIRVAPELAARPLREEPAQRTEAELAPA